MGSRGGFILGKSIYSVIASFLINAPPIKTKLNSEKTSGDEGDSRGGTLMP